MRLYSVVPHDSGRSSKSNKRRCRLRNRWSWDPQNLFGVVTAAELRMTGRLVAADPTKRRSAAAGGAPPTSANQNRICRALVGQADPAAIAGPPGGAWPGTVALPPGQCRQGRGGRGRLDEPEFELDRGGRRVGENEVQLGRPRPLRPQRQSRGSSPPRGAAAGPHHHRHRRAPPATPAPTRSRTTWNSFPGLARIRDRESHEAQLPQRHHSFPAAFRGASVSPRRLVFKAASRLFAPSGGSVVVSERGEIHSNKKPQLERTYSGPTDPVNDEQ